MAKDTEMTIPEVMGIVEKIKYKPGSVIKLIRSADRDTCRLHMRLRVEDTNKPGTYIVITSLDERESVWFINQTPTSLLSWIRSALIRLETHEVDEWFRYCEEQVFEPHDLVKQALVREKLGL